MIYDSDGNRILSAEFDLAIGGDQTISLLIDCLSGWQLSGEAVADVTVTARHGSTGGYTNIETTPIALDAWDGTQQVFEIRAVRDNTTTGVRNFNLTVARA